MPSPRHGWTGLAVVAALASTVGLWQCTGADGADVTSRRAAADRPLPPSAVDRRDTRGRTALMVAAGRGDADAVQRLLRAGADVNARNPNGGTALMYAAVNGDPETLQRLLDHGAKVNLAGVNGWTALMVAAAKGHAPAARLLLKAGADPGAADIFQWTPLMRAAYEGRTGVVRVLLDYRGAAVNAVDDKGATALHHAAAQGEKAICRLLLAHGARVMLRDAAGRTPVDIARQAGYPELAKAIAAQAR